MAYSLAVITVVIGRRRSQSAGLRRRGPPGSFSNKREQRQLLSPHSTPLKIWNGDLGVARCQIFSTWKVWGHIWSPGVYICAAVAEILCNCKNPPCVKDHLKAHHRIYLTGGVHIHARVFFPESTALLYGLFAWQCLYKITRAKDWAPLLNINK